MADDYRTTEVGERYAQALFDLADETGALEAVRADLASLRAAWNESADLRRLAHSPVIAAVRSSFGCGGQSARAQDGPAAWRFCSSPESPSRRKNSAHCPSTKAGSVA